VRCGGESRTPPYTCVSGGGTTVPPPLFSALKRILDLQNSACRTRQEFRRRCTATGPWEENWGDEGSTGQPAHADGSVPVPPPRSTRPAFRTPGGCRVSPSQLGGESPNHRSAPNRNRRPQRETGHPNWRSCLYGERFDGCDPGKEPTTNQERGVNPLRNPPPQAPRA